MLSKRARLSRTAFTALKESSTTRTVYNKLGTLYFASGALFVSFSVVISGKAVKRAVDRNKIRRRIYSIVRSYPFPTPIQGILYTAKNINTYSFDEIKTLLEELCKKATR